MASNEVNPEILSSRIGGLFYIERTLLERIRNRAKQNKRTLSREVEYELKEYEKTRLKYLER